MPLSFTPLNSRFSHFFSQTSKSFKSVTRRYSFAHLDKTLHSSIRNANRAALASSYYVVAILCLLTWTGAANASNSHMGSISCQHNIQNNPNVTSTELPISIEAASFKSATNESTLVDANQPNHTNTSKPFYYIDATVADAHTLKSDILAKANQRDVHLFTHGRPGELLINGQWLGAVEIAAFVKQQFNVGGTTSNVKPATLNLYGCEFAKGEKGAAAVNYLENQLGIAVAASTNITGADGDWILEVGKASVNIDSDYEHSLQCANFGTAASQDYDCDGVINSSDLDDDNDGILDTDEVRNFFISGAFNALPPGTTFGTSAVLWTGNSSLTTPPFSATDVNFSGTVGVATNSGTAAAFILQTPLQANTRYRWSFDASKTSSVPFVGNLNVNVRNSSGTVVANLVNQNGGIATWTQFTGSFTPTITGTYTLTFESAGNGTAAYDYFFDRVFFGPYDNDGDGILNKFDLDTDGDGCSDAIEGGGNFNSSHLVTSTMPGGNSGGGYVGVSASPVNSNLGNSVNASGVPTIATASGQSVGTSQMNGVASNNTSTVSIVENQTKTLVATPSGGTWSIVSGGGTISGNTYTPANVTSNTSVTVRYTISPSGCNTFTNDVTFTVLSDNDSDGIADDIDLDDDNDGILDTDDCSPGPFSGLPFSAIALNGVNGTGGVYGLNNAINGITNANEGVWIAINNAANNVLTLTLASPINNSNFILKYTNDWGADNIESNSRMTAIKLYDSGGNLIKQIAPVDNLSTNPNASKITFYNEPSSFTGNLALATPLAKNIAMSSLNNDAFTVDFDEVFDLATIEITGIQAVTQSNGAVLSIREISIETSSLNTAACVPFLDLDGDGVLDKFDLDSDNDGCPDAIEATGTVIASQLNADGSISGAVNANGVPTLAAAGGGAGQNQTTAGNTAEQITVVTAPTNQTVNTGSSATFTVSANRRFTTTFSAGVPTYPAAVTTGLTYRWYKNTAPNTTLSTASSLTISNVQASNIGDYSVEITGIYNNCPEVSTATLALCPVASNTTSTASITENQTKALVATPSGGTWSVVSGGGTISGTTYTPANVTSNTNVTVRYTIAASGGCSASTSDRTFTVTACPVASNTTSTASITENQTKALVATPTGGTWSVVSGGGTISGTTYTPANVTSNTNVTVRYTIAASGGCNASTSDRTFTVTACPVASNTTSTASITENQTKALVATPTGGTWSVVSGGGTISGTTYTPANVTSNTNVTVRYTIAASGGCNASTSDVTFTVTACPVASNTTTTASITEDQTKALVATPSGGTWSVVSGGGTISGTTYTPANVTSNTNVTVRYTIAASGGCNASTSDRYVYCYCMPSG